MLRRHTHHPVSHCKDTNALIYPRRPASPCHLVVVREQSGGMRRVRVCSKGLGSHGQFIRRGQSNVHTRTLLLCLCTFNLFSLREKFFLHLHTFNKGDILAKPILLAMWLTHTCVYTLREAMKTQQHILFISLCKA